MQIKSQISKIKYQISKVKMAEGGSATILTLLISAIVITVGIGFNWIVKEHLRAAEGLKVKTEAMLKARSAYDTLLYLILSGKRTSKEILFSDSNMLGIAGIPLNGKVVSVDKGITVRLQDSSGLLSLVGMNTDALARLLKIVGYDKDPNIVIDSLLDWVDTDKLSHVNGAEESYYSMNGQPYTARNFPVQYKEELSFIRGVGRDLYDKLSPYITMLPALGFNPNTANDEVLMAYLDINRDVLETLKAYISQKPVTSNHELFRITGRTLSHVEEGVYFFSSPFIEISVESGTPRPMYRINCGIDTRQKINLPYSVIYWREG